MKSERRDGEGGLCDNKLGHQCLRGYEVGAELVRQCGRSRKSKVVVVSGHEVQCIQRTIIVQIMLIIEIFYVGLLCYLECILMTLRKYFCIFALFGSR